MYLDHNMISEVFASLRQKFEGVGLCYGSIYADYASFHFDVPDLGFGDVAWLIAELTNRFQGMEMCELTIQPGRKDGNVWVTACHDLISTSNNQI